MTNNDLLCAMIPIQENYKYVLTKGIHFRYKMD